MKGWQQSDIDRLKTRGYDIIDTMRKQPPASALKYNNKKTDIEGITFDSKKEAKRYKELRILLKAGKIGFLARQVSFELNSSGTHSLKYVADFAYTDSKTGKLIIEDVKGFRTREFIKKKRLMKKVHGVDVIEV